MKNVNKIAHIAFIISAVIISGCKKYEEGPCFSLRSKENRVRGEWELEYLYINGVDSTQAVKSQTCYGNLFINTESKHYLEGNWDLKYDYHSCNRCDGTWSFEDKNRVFIFDVEERDTTDFKPVGPYMNIKHRSWEIRRLTKDQFWIATNFNGDECWVHFKKK
jgi:hypothetical protein